MEKKERALKIALIAAVLVFILLIFYTNLFHYNYKMNADIGAEAILGELIWQSKEILPDTWYPSTEARIISTPNIAALFYGMTGNMTLAMGLGCCFMTVLIALAIRFFCKKAGIKETGCLMMVFLSLAVPVNFTFLELVYVFAGYYAIQTAVLFFTLGIYTETIHTAKVKYLWLLAGGVAALLLGFQGMRGILVLYGPLFGIEAVRRAWLLYNRQKADWTDQAVSLWVLLLLAISFAGSRFPFSASQGISTNIRNGFTKLFTVALPDMGKILGFGESHILSQICMFVLGVLAVYTAVDILWRLLRKKKVLSVEWAYLTVFASPVVTAFMVAFTTVESTPRYYFMQIYAIAFSTVLVCRKLHFAAIAVGIAVLALSLVNIYQVYLPVCQSEEPPRTDAYKVVQYLEANSIYTAYADFENANTMTTLSNGRVRVAAVSSISRMDMCRWLSSTWWYPPSQPYECVTAYIITSAEEEEFKQFMDGKEGTIRKADEFGKYKIYVSDYNYANLGGE